MNHVRIPNSVLILDELPTGAASAAEESSIKALKRENGKMPSVVFTSRSVNTQFNIVTVAYTFLLVPHLRYYKMKSNGHTRETRTLF